MVFTVLCLAACQNFKIFIINFDPATPCLKIILQKYICIYLFPNYKDVYYRNAVFVNKNYQ